MPFNPTPQSEYALHPLPGTSQYVWMKKMTDPEGLGRGWGWTMVTAATATIDTGALALEISNASPSVFGMVDRTTGTEFVRRISYDTAGVQTGVLDILPDGTPYVSSGNEELHPKERETFVIASESIPFDGTVRSLASVPVNADWAQIHVWDGEIAWTQSGVPPTPAAFDAYRQTDGTTFWLRSKDEIDKFQFVGYNGGVGELYVEYIELR